MRASGLNMYRMSHARANLRISVLFILSGPGIATSESLVRPRIRDQTRSDLAVVRSECADAPKLNQVPWNSVTCAQPD